MITGLGFQEITLILAIVLIVFGPRRLPELMRRAGQLSREFRRIAWEFRSALDIESLEETRRELRPDPYENQSEHPKSEPEEEYGKPPADAKETNTDQETNQPTGMNIGEKTGEVPGE